MPWPDGLHTERLRVHSHELFGVLPHERVGHRPGGDQIGRAVRNFANTIGGAWNTTYFIVAAFRPSFRSKMTPERKGQDSGFRTYRNCREMLRNG